jgi:hypothetical protein
MSWACAWTFHDALGNLVCLPFRRVVRATDGEFRLNSVVTQHALHGQIARLLL